MALLATQHYMWQVLGVPLCLLATYPAPDRNSVLVHEAHLDEFPKTKKELNWTQSTDAEWHFLSKSPGHKTGQNQFCQAALSGGDVDSTVPVVTFLTWLLISDLPPHRFPDVCRWCALGCRLGNRFPFRQSWPQWFSPCWRGRWPSSPRIRNAPPGCRGRHTYKTKVISRVFIHTFKIECYNWLNQ